MEKLSLYLFSAGLITLGISALAYVLYPVLRLRSAQGLVLRTVPAADVDAPAPIEGLVRYGSFLGWTAAAMLVLSLVSRGFASGRGPFSNMYEFSTAFACGILLAALAIDWRYRAWIVSGFAVLVALALLVYASMLPNEIEPLVPALQNAPLLTAHVAVAIIAYSAFAVASVSAVLYLAKSRLRIEGLPSLETLDDIGYRAVAIGFPFMALVLILGAFWANVAWGHYWSWDPKETGSLVTWLIYGAYLHARTVRGWRGTPSAALLLLGFVAVLVTYYGNYFLGGLHSYASAQ